MPRGAPGRAATGPMLVVAPRGWAKPTPTGTLRCSTSAQPLGSRSRYARHNQAALSIVGKGGVWPRSRYTPPKASNRICAAAGTSAAISERTCNSPDIRRSPGARR